MLKISRQTNIVSPCFANDLITFPQRCKQNVMNCVIKRYDSESCLSLCLCFDIRFVLTLRREPSDWNHILIEMPLGGKWPQLTHTQNISNTWLLCHFQWLYRIKRFKLFPMHYFLRIAYLRLLYFIPWSEHDSMLSPAKMTNLLVYVSTIRFL